MNNGNSSKNWSGYIIVQSGESVVNINPETETIHVIQPSCLRNRKLIGIITDNRVFYLQFSTHKQRQPPETMLDA